MTDRLREVSERITAVTQLETVMTAMRGIAAAHLREVQTQLPSIRAYANTVGVAIGEVMAFLPATIVKSDENKSDGSELIVVLSAEQGFAGNFNERLFDVLQRYIQNNERAAILLIGSRGLGAAQERNIPVLETFAMTTRVDSIATLAVTLADWLYTRISEGGYNRVSLLHSTHDVGTGRLMIARRSLIPFDYSRFEIAVRLVEPMLTQDPVSLSLRLAEEYVFAELCEALMLSHAAENEARVRAMVRARANVLDTQKTLRANYQQLRQDQITAEISELTTGRLASTQFAYQID